MADEHERREEPKDRQERREPKEPTPPPDTKATEEAILETVRALREDPERYRALRASLAAAETDEERVRHLVTVATTDRELAALMPKRPPGQTELAWTTVTVTTVLIPDSAY